MEEARHLHAAGEETLGEVEAGDPKYVRGAFFDPAWRGGQRACWCGRCLRLKHAESSHEVRNVRTERLQARIGLGLPSEGGEKEEAG